MEHDDIQRIKAIEHRHIELTPEGEREEVRQIFARKGFAGADLNRAVELITADRKRWVQTMLADEYGLPPSVRSPWLAASSTFSAFLVCGLVPLIPFLVGSSRPLTIAIVMSGGVFFAIGSLKSRWSTASWWRSGLSTFLVGGIAALLAYVAGIVLKNIASY